MTTTHPPEAPLSPPRLRLGTVDDLCREHPAFTPHAVRAMIQRGERNGLARHVYRLGRRVTIDLNGFSAWVSEHQQGRTAR